MQDTCTGRQKHTQTLTLSPSLTHTHTPPPYIYTHPYTHLFTLSHNTHPHIEHTQCILKANTKHMIGIEYRLHKSGKDYDFLAYCWEFLSDIFEKSAQQRKKRAMPLKRYILTDIKIIYHSFRCCADFENFRENPILSIHF